MSEDIGMLSIPVKKRMRFREEDDIALLREVAGQNPFLNPGVWDVIKEHVFLLTAKNFSVKSLKDHLDLLIKLWLNKTQQMKYKSGTEEDYTEKEQLCQNIYDYMSQFRDKQKKNCLKKMDIKNGKKNRDEWARNLHNKNNIKIEVIESALVTDKDDFTIEELDDSIDIEPESIIDVNKALPIESNSAAINTSTQVLNTRTQIKSVPETTKVFRPIRARKRKINVQRQGLSYLEQYDQRQLEIKKQDQILEKRRIDNEEKKIAVEERKMELEEKKFNLEEYERKKNLEILEGRLANDIEQRKVMSNIIERQEKIIQMLLSNIKK